MSTPDQKEQPAFPRVTRRDRYRWLRLLGRLGATGGFLSWLWLTILNNVWRIPWREPASDFYVFLFLFACTSCALLPPCVLWLRRRVALQVDEVGVHEQFADGSSRTLGWDEVDAILHNPPGYQGWMVVPKDFRNRPVRFDIRLEDAHAVAALIHARIHHLPLLSPAELPAPSAEDIQAFFRRPPPVSLVDFPSLGALGMQVIAFLVCGAAMVSANARMMGDLAWVMGAFMAVTAAALVYLVWRIDQGFRIVVDEEGVQLGGFFQSRRRMPWKEIVGRDEWTIKGVFRDLTLPLDFHGGEKVLEFIDRLMDQRAQTGGLKLTDKPSEAALMLVEPGATGEPSAAALTEVSQHEAKPRLSGRELEAKESLAGLRAED